MAAPSFLLVAFLVAGAASAHDGTGHAEAMAEAESSYTYAPPEVGSYELPVIDRVEEHRMLAGDGAAAPLLDLEDGELAIVSFVYLNCADAHGCPLTLATLLRTDRELAERPELARRVRLVTVSFDPARDTPAAMAGLAERLAPRTSWRFLTSANRDRLDPVLRDYGQDAVPVLTRDGERSGLLSHVAKVFLVDAQGGVRNVYSSAFLDHRLLLRDVETLLAAQD